MQYCYFDFNYKKATQALAYFAEKSGGTINRLKGLKLIYFADRYHLRKYGRLITNDTYFAMDNGSGISVTAIFPLCRIQHMFTMLRAAIMLF